LDCYFTSRLTLLNIRLTLSTIGTNLLTHVIGHMQYQLSILGNEFQMIWTCRADLPAMWRRHSIQRFVSMCPNRLKDNQGSSKQDSNDRYLHFFSSRYESEWQKNFQRHINPDYSWIPSRDARIQARQASRK